MLRYPAFCITLILLIPAMLFAEQKSPIRVLYFTRSAGWEHEVVKWKDGGRSHSETVLQSLGREHGFDFTFSKDGSLFSRDYLDRFDVIMFYTSGDLLSAGGDGHPPMTPAGKEALLKAVESGKGFVGVHSASDTFHTGEHGAGNPAGNSGRYKLHGDDADPFIRMLGGEFISHGAQQMARARVVDPSFPGFTRLGDGFELHEEWYSTKEFAQDLHVLLVLETDEMDGRVYRRPPFPIAWARLHGEGRVWYNAMGHREDVWDDRRFQSMLVGGIQWAGRRADAEIRPNLRSAAPEAKVLPPAPE